MASILPILIPGPRTPPEPTARQLGKQRDAAAKAAKGHRDAAAWHKAEAEQAKDNEAHEGHLGVAKAHETAALDFEQQVYLLGKQIAEAEARKAALS